LNEGDKGRWDDFKAGITELGVECQTAGGAFQKTSCQVASTIRDHQVFFGAGVGALLLLCFLRCVYVCCCRSRRDDRGEYRAVAARFGNDDDNAFDDAASEGSFYDEDSEEDDWTSGHKASLEMVSRERNGGLTLEEING
jgi:hypothetical protein